MAYRRRQSNPKTLSTFKDFRSNPDLPSPSSPAAAAEKDGEEPPSLAAQAIRASSAHRDSSFSSAYYGERVVPSSSSSPSSNSKESSNRDSGAEYISMKNLNESKYGFWGVLARKAKSLIDDDNTSSKSGSNGRKQPQMSTSSGQFQQSYQSPEEFQKAEGASSQKSSDSIASSLNHIGGAIKHKLEEGLTMVENRTADIIQETRKMNVRRKGSGYSQNQATDKPAMHNFPQVQADHETQLKASRDVANAMAAKAKLLLRELKTIKADLAFARERCAQLEEENKMLRENHEKGGPEDDDLIRLQLETLLAEKGRLAHENSVYARENRFLREIVEYHQLTMQDVVYVDEGIEEVTEVFSNSPNQILSRTGSVSTSSNIFDASTSIEEHPSTHTPNTVKPPAIVVPEACPIIPTPPTPRTSPHSYKEDNDVAQKQ